jgi:hypothetical protein
MRPRGVRADGGRWPQTGAARLDHLVVAAESLLSGSAVVERVLGVRLSSGGKHARMGTENCLLGVGKDAYLEVIAIDPHAPPPNRPRWLTLDEASTRARLEAGPCLVHWVARVESTTVPWLPLDPGPWEPFERNALAWKLTVRPDGTLPADGVAPSLIRWDGPEHPAGRLPEAGCGLEALELEHPGASAVQATLDALGLPFHCTPGKAPRLTVRLLTPSGLRTLHSGEPMVG